MAGSYWLISRQGIRVYRSRPPGVQACEYKYNRLSFLVCHKGRRFAEESDSRNRDRPLCSQAKAVNKEFILTN